MEHVVSSQSTPWFPWHPSETLDMEMDLFKSSSHNLSSSKMRFPFNFCSHTLANTDFKYTIFNTPLCTLYLFLYVVICQSEFFSSSCLSLLTLVYFFNPFFLHLCISSLTFPITHSLRNSGDFPVASAKHYMASFFI